MNTYINTVTHSIFDEKYMLLYKKTIFLKIFPPRCLFSLLCDEAFTASFQTKNILKKSYSSPAIQPYHWFIFVIFFQRMKNAQKISLVFFQFSNGSSLLVFDFLKILKIYLYSVQKELSNDTKISYTLIFASLSFPASCVI